ncbi:hypothetical protein HDU85_001075 [Gaertneriomyces sp. JEL0708]|nr:hypothetical protein HDU85_001075 [Gaertneriomyces sp. JEL0708]
MGIRQSKTPSTTAVSTLESWEDLGVAADVPKPAHPSPDRLRSNWLNLNGQWEFSLNEPRYDRHITVPYSWASPLSGIEEDVKGIAYYRRRVRYTPQNIKTPRLFLVFGAVDYSCRITVNGVDFGGFIGGYSRFEFDVTHAWKNDAENEVLVAVRDDDNDNQMSGKQGYGQLRGIWQTVFLEERGEVWLSEWKVTTQMNGTVRIDYHLGGVGDVEMVQAQFENVAVSGNRGVLELVFCEPHLWSVDDPYLYEGTLRVKGKRDDLAFEDVVETYFGIREIGQVRFSEGGAMHVTLNGRPLFLCGVLDQSFNPRGFFTAPTDNDCKRDIERIKALGLNFARIHVKADEPLKLYWADKLGVLISQDIPNHWGEPTPDTRKKFETAMWEIVKRDVNHPSIIQWVMFNETWGLESNGRYLPETQEWVRGLYRALKSYDPTRFVEDNSASQRDHVETDVNSWHFYSNGYNNVKKTIADFCDGAFPGSPANFIGGNLCGDVPFMNSECGAVWGIIGSAGDSDIAWHYKYMINEIRRHEKLSGYVFTELTDVVNEFNGFYRIHGTPKEFGYGDYVEGMSLLDLHSPTFLGFDYPPMETRNAGEHVVVPIFISVFDQAFVGITMRIQWELVYVDCCGDKHSEQRGNDRVQCSKLGVTPLSSLRIQLPKRDGLAVLCVWLLDQFDAIIMRNYVLFDVVGPLEHPALSLEPRDMSFSGFKRAWELQNRSKYNCVGKGSACFFVDTSQVPGFMEANNLPALQITFEASSKEELTKDKPETERPKHPPDGDYMRGYRVDRGANPNSFYMTDESVYPSTIKVYVGSKGEADIRLPDIQLPNCPADSRGCLSWHYQAHDDRLDEAGSYGYMCQITIPQDTVRKFMSGFNVRLETDDGVSYFGRKSGRYPTGIRISALREPGS